MCCVCVFLNFPTVLSFVVIATILSSCVFMTMKNPPVWISSLGITAVYTVEVIVKVMSRGILIGRFSFLRDPWNWLDILVIIFGYVPLFVDLGKVSVLSSALQVLKLLPLIPGMKTTVSTLVQSGRRLVGVMVLTVLTLSIFALIGHQLFMGNLRQKCFLLPSKEMDNKNSYYGNGTGGSNFNYSNILNEQAYFLPHNLDPLLCGNSSDSGLCPEGFTCLAWGKNPNYGFTSFDTFGWSLLNMIRLLTQDFWENLMMLTLRAAGKVYLITFVLIFFPGCFCLLSLIVASVAMAISEQEQAVIVEALRKEKEFIQIQEALKRNDKHEQVACRGRPSETKTGEMEEKSTELEGSDGSCSPCCVLCLKWNCCGCWQWLKQRLHTLVMNPFFELIIVLCLIVNIIFMATEHFPMTEHFNELLAISHLVFTYIFIAEMLLKVVAMDPYGYFQVGWNIFDSIIVVISLIIPFTNSIHDHSYILLLRVFRLARWWPSFHMLLKMVWTSLRALMNLTLVLLILVFVFSVVGMQLFHKDYEDCVCRISLDCTLPRWHMNDFFHTFLIVFRVLIGQWIETTWDCMEVSGPAMCLIFFMVVMVIGNLLVLNLFLTMVLSWFNGDSLLLSERKEKKNPDIAIDQIKKAFWALLGKEKPDPTDANSKDSNRKEYLALDVVTSDQPVSENQDLSGKTSKHVDTKSQSAPIAEIEDELKTTDDKEERVKRSDDDVLNHPECEQDEHNKGVKGNTPEDCCCDMCYRCCPFLDLNKSQGTGRVWSNFRRSCLSIVQHRVFEAFMIIIIVLSSAALVFEDIHLPQRPALKIAVETADQVFTFIFLLEMLLKWSAFGLKKYFTNGWCWLDFLILNVSLTCVTTDLLGQSKPLAALWSLRALIPLRTLSRFQGLRVVIRTLVQTLPSLVNGVLVFLIVWLFYSILGVNLFAGKFWYCYDETTEQFFTTKEVDNKTQCFELMYVNSTEVRWKNIKLNFDNVANGYLSLVIVTMSSGWFDAMYAAVDSKQVESQPEYEYNLPMSLYFIFFIISTFFTFIFFIRVIIDSLQTEKTGKHCFATEDQMKKIEALKIRLLSKSPAPRPQNPCLARLFDLVTSQWFEVFMVVVVFLNMVVLMVETPYQSFQTEIILNWFQFVFLIIFLMEFIMKIIPLQQHYFTSGWNILDFVVLLYLLIGLFISDFLEKYFITPTWFSILRLVRVMRVIHLVQGGIRKLLSNFMMSLPALFNISLLLFLITFSFSIFGMFNFAYIKKAADIDDMWNFETFWSSLTCMIMTSTTSGWYGFLLPIMDTPPDCDPFMENPGLMGIGDCGNPITGVIFFTTFITLTSLLLVYLYIAVVMETFSLEDVESLSDEGLQMFYNTWMKFDPDATQCIQKSELSEFCSALQGPLKIPKPNSIKLTNMDLPLLPGDKIHCMDILSALHAQVFGDSGDVDALKDRLQDKFNEKSPKQVSSEPISSTLQGKLEEEVAMVSQLKDAEEVADGSMGGANGSSGV
uniref:Sodium channel protein type 3 subunit alpha-like n=1 Tax=Labrus bergylta TaxID=56723 RepID=A0A3Q3F795_9LABR